MVVLCLLFSVASAQHVLVSGSASPSPHFSVAYYVPTPGGGSVQAGLGYQAPGLQVFAELTHHLSASTISNVTIEAAAHATFHGLYHVSAGARGTIGPVAARLRARVYHAPLGTFSAHEQLFPSRPAGTGWGVVASATYRHENLVFVAEPTIDFANGVTYTTVTGDVRWLRAIGPHELRFRTNIHLRPTFSGDVGATMVLHRSRKPAWEMGGFITFSEAGVAPGVHVLYHETFPGFSVKVRAELAPYSAVDPFFALEASVNVPLHVGSLMWDAALAVRNEVLGVTELRWTLPLP